MTTVNEFIESIEDPEHRKAIKAVRRTVRRLVPDGDEVITYAMPGMKVQGGAVIAYAPAKKHLGLYPCSGRTVLELLESYPDLDTTKGAVRLAYDDSRRDEIVAEIIRLRRVALGV